MARTALIVIVKEAEEVVREIRRQHDWSASRGVPAHITVLFPFADSLDVDEAALAAAFARHDSFPFVLDRIEHWSDGIVWLHPEPSQPFEELTAAVRRRWPSYPPYAGTIEAVVPHLTVSEIPIELDINLPITSRAREVTLIEEQPDDTWATRATFSLGHRGTFT